MPHFIICYDISNPKRLQRVHRAMKQEATPIEYSVFFFDGTEAQVQNCLRKVESLINPHKDDVRCYPISEKGWQYRLGKAVLPSGIIWTALPVTWNRTIV